MDPQIPDKLYFKIGEVAELTGVKPHVLRYWEAEVASIRPGKNRHQQRLYCRRDIELILRLKELLYTQGYTIAGARKLLRRKSVVGPLATVPVSPSPAVLVTALHPATACDQLSLPLGGGIDRSLLDELRRDLVRIRDSLTAVP